MLYHAPAYSFADEVLSWIFDHIQLVETAGLMIIIARSRAGKRITASRALVGMARQWLALIGAALAECLVLLAWTAPALGLGGLLYFVLQATHDINYYLWEWPPVFILAVSVMSLVGLGLAAVLLRYFVLWTFVVPVCLFEQQTLFQALRRSARLVKGAFWRVLGIITAWTAVIVLCEGVVMALLQRRAAMDPGEKLRMKFKRLLDSLAE